METNVLYNQDCLKGMQEIPDESIDLVVTDCPYHIAHHGTSCGGGIFSDLQNKHANSGKLFAHNDIAFSEWLPDVYRVLKQCTHCHIMVNAHNLKELQIEAEKVGFIFQNLLVWKKDNSTPNKFYMNQLEFILMLRKGAAKYVNDMGITNCLSCPNIIGKGAKGAHPTAKPVPLMELLIKQSSNASDIVLDPFSGGGSTLIAAKRLKRQYIGFEIDPEYYTIADRRLTKDPQEISLFD